MSSQESVDSDIKTVDGSDELKALQTSQPDLLKVFAQLPVALISEADGMYSRGNENYYFTCGLDAMRRCTEALAKREVDKRNVKNVLDYACGFGRVGRALQAAFPDATLLGVDVDKKAIAHYSHILNVETAALDSSPQAASKLSGTFDLIWIGSLFTHLPQYFVQMLLNDLAKLLTDQGVFGFTLHGDYVVGRLESGIEYGGDVMRVVQRDYGLPEGEVREVVSGYRSAGYGFAPYPYASSYGISATGRTVIEEIVDEAGLEFVSYQTRGWMKHQDFCAVAVKPS